MENDGEEVYEWKKIKDEITCSICGDIFTDPKTVPCLHTFCKVCLKKSIEMNKSFKSDVCCPLCRAKLKQDDVSLIPNNFVTKRLVEIYYQQEGRRKSANIAQRNLQSTATAATTSGDALQSPRRDQTNHSHHPVYIAKYSYSPRRKSELGFKKGDKLYIMNTGDHDWWLGKNEDLSGQVGYIPSNYVVEFGRSTNPPQAPPRASQSQLKEETEKKFGPQGLNNYQRCIANYTYSPEQENFLSFNKGEMLCVIKTNVNDDSNWWLAARMGFIPTSYVSEVRTNQLQNIPEEIQKKLEAVKACNFKYPLVIAKYSYSPRKGSELGFKEGDLLHVVNSDDRDWWLAGQVGYVPTNYVSLVNNNNADQAVPINNSSSSYPLYIAKYNYSSRTKDDLNFKKGDLLYISVIDDDGWWLARSKDTSQQGFIPSSYVREYKSLLDAEDWYFGAISRKYAEEILMQPPNDDGSFLVRVSVNSSSGYTFVLRDGINTKSWKINKSNDGKYYIRTDIMFASLSQLVAYHTENAKDHSTPCVPSEVQRTAGLCKMTNKAWKIQRSSLELCNKFNTGNFGEVWEAMWNNTTPVIVNTLNPGTITVSDFLKEATVLKQLRHRNVVQLYAVCAEEEPIYVVTEPTKYGNLRDHLRGDGRNLQLTQLISMGAQVAAGMAYLEKNSYVHGNLTAKSVFVSEHFICRIGELGFINALSKVARKELIRSQTKWLAPEVLNKSPVTTKSDVWSFGILLYEVVTYGRVPYPGISNCQVKEKLLRGYRMHCPMACPEQLHKIMMKCWNDDADSRPTFETLQWQLEEFFIDDVLYAATVIIPYKIF